MAVTHRAAIFYNAFVTENNLKNMYVIYDRKTFSTP